MADPRSPVLLRHLDKVVGFLVPRTKVSFLVPDSRSSFRILVPRSGSNLQIYQNTNLRFTLFFADETLSPGKLVSNLTMRGSTVGTVLYSCTATNSVGTSEQKTCRVTIIRKGEVCFGYS